MFRRPAIEALESAGVPWQLAVDSSLITAVQAIVSADLGIYVQLRGAVDEHCEAIRHGGALPALPDYLINMYVGSGPRAPLSQRLADFVRQAYCQPARLAAE
jgi:hypothetical protein